VTLKPTPGFCIKSFSLRDGVYTTGVSGSRINVPKGLKVFVNICWDSKVPPPPEASEDAIRRAMIGEDADDFNPDGWYVPVVVSEGRQDTDKAGKPSLVFDAVFNSSLKSRTLRDAEFKVFLIELAIQRIEAETSIHLSRQISSPNILSKGQVAERTVRIPTVMSTDDAPKKNLIQEITSVNESKQPIPKGILKSAPSDRLSPSLEEPSWTWSESDQRIVITIKVPKLTRDLIPSSTLDLESRRLLLHVPSLYSLDVNLDLPDELLGISNSALTLKRMRDFNIDGAKADWRIAEGAIVASV